MLSKVETGSKKTGVIFNARSAISSADADDETDQDVDGEVNTDGQEWIQFKAHEVDGEDGDNGGRDAHKRRGQGR